MQRGPKIWKMGWILAGMGISLLACSPLPVATHKNSADDDAAMQINLKMQKFTLDNGLTVILVEDHRLPIIAYHTLYKVGAINENAANNGVSHFLEHMMFKKTSDLADGEFDRFVR